MFTDRNAMCLTLYAISNKVQFCYQTTVAKQQVNWSSLYQRDPLLNEQNEYESNFKENVKYSTKD